MSFNRALEVYASAVAEACEAGDQTSTVELDRLETELMCAYDGLLQWALDDCPATDDPCEVEQDLNFLLHTKGIPSPYEVLRHLDRCSL